MAFDFCTGFGKETNSAHCFHEVTPEPSNRPGKHPRELDQHLVDAQQARRILDRGVWYELSPSSGERSNQAFLQAGPKCSRQVSG
ncbi:MAG: hypothetical protein Ct9H90mP9_0010 [Pseudomonadota bacterium]|nr:MAG: hypothetical protein Ct9H90mP9_0010 [Pseudomonadota bacterium]